MLLPFLLGLVVGYNVATAGFNHLIHKMSLKSKIWHFLEIKYPDNLKLGVLFLFTDIPFMLSESVPPVTFVYSTFFGELTNRKLIESHRIESNRGQIKRFHDALNRCLKKRNRIESLWG